MTSQKEDQVYHYEFFTGMFLPDEMIARAMAEGWEIGSTDKRPPNVRSGLPTWSHNIQSWYIRPVVHTKKIETYETQWELNPSPDFACVDHKGDFYVMDNVFLDFDKVLRFSLNQDYAQRTATFHCEFSNLIHCSAILNTIGRVVGGPVTYGGSGLNSAFKINQGSDGNKLNRIHKDRDADWAVVIFMNETEDPRRSGTTLYQHKELPRLVDDSEWDMEFRKQIFLDGHDESKFKRIYTCPMVQNRMFLYRANMFHREEEFFNGRKVFRMFLNYR